MADAEEFEAEPGEFDFDVGDVADIEFGGLVAEQPTAAAADVVGVEFVMFFAIGDECGGERQGEEEAESDSGEEGDPGEEGGEPGPGESGEGGRGDGAGDDLGD